MTAAGLRSFALVCAVLLSATPTGAQQGGPPPVVKVAEPLVERIRDWDEYTGRFIPAKAVELKARVSGYLNRIAFKEGDLVREGQLLYEIDPRPFEAELESAEAQLRAAEARRDVARTEAERALALYRRQVGSEQDFERARGTYAEAVANVALAQAAIRMARLNLEFTQIKAPIAGRISATQIDRGNLVVGGANGAAALATIVSLDPIEFTFTASEADYLRYIRLARSGERASSREVENEVQLRLMDEDRWTRRGRMTFVDNRLDPNSGTIEGRATFDNPDSFLTPGVFGRLRIIASGEYDAVLIPDEAIVSDQSRKLVYVIGAEDVVEARPVRPGPQYRGLRVIRDGVEPGDRVIVTGVQRARPGSPVTVEETALALDPEADG